MIPGETLDEMREVAGRRGNAGVIALLDAIDELDALGHEKDDEIARLRGVMADLSCDGCAYGDCCPGNANHYVCVPCQLMRALKA